MNRHLVTIARLEFVTVARLRWIRLLAAAFALLAAAAAYAAGAASELSAPDGFARTTMVLVPIVLVLAPLAALVLGIAGQSAEPGTEPYLFAQPVGRVTVIVGRWMGEAAALSAAILVGLGAGAALVAWAAGFDGIASYGALMAATVVLAAIFLSIAAAVAAFLEKRTAALGAGTFVWFVFVLLYDGVALSLAGWLTGSFGAHVLFGSVFGNPADLIRVLTLSVAGTPNVLGAAGDAWIRFAGGPAEAALAATGALTVWLLAPLGLAVWAIDVRDL